MEVTLIAEDFSALGKISMVSALSIYAAMDLQTAALPTTLLSTQTEGFGVPSELKINQWIPQTLLHWQATNEVVFKSALIGYVGNIQVVQQLNSFFKNHKLKRVIVDPVMGDQGKLYPGFDSAYVEDICILSKKATIITPNWTELHLLADEKIQCQVTEDRIKMLIKKLREKQITAQVVITGLVFKDKMGICYVDENNKFNWYLKEEIKGHFYGAGDVFSAIFSAYLDFGLNIKEALEKTIDDLYETIIASSKKIEYSYKYGLSLNGLLANLTAFSLENKR